MRLERVTVNAFCLIGRLGSTEEGTGVVSRLWKEANERFAEVAPLAKRDENGAPVGFWGAMSRMDMSFLPWEDDFTRGLYMAGVEAESDAVPPKGWEKWIVPGFECARFPAEGENAFRDALACMKENRLELVAAVQDFTDPATGKSYMLFPYRWLDAEADPKSPR